MRRGLGARGNAARDNKKKTIAPRHVQLAVRNDEELNKLLGSHRSRRGGVLPNLHKELLPSKLGGVTIASGERPEPGRGPRRTTTTGAGPASASIRPGLEGQTRRDLHDHHYRKRGQYDARRRSARLVRPPTPRFSPGLEVVEPAPERRRRPGELAPELVLGHGRLEPFGGEAGGDRGGSGGARGARAPPPATRPATRRRHVVRRPRRRGGRRRHHPRRRRGRRREARRPRRRPRRRQRAVRRRRRRPRDLLWRHQRRERRRAEARAGPVRSRGDLGRRALVEPATDG